MDKLNKYPPIMANLVSGRALEIADDFKIYPIYVEGNLNSFSGNVIRLINYCASLENQIENPKTQLKSVMKWMGKRKSNKKAVSSRENGKKGGRPKKTVQV